MKRKTQVNVSDCSQSNLYPAVVILSRGWVGGEGEVDLSYLQATDDDKIFVTTL